MRNNASQKTAKLLLKYTTRFGDTINQEFYIKQLSKK